MDVYRELRFEVAHDYDGQDVRVEFRSLMTALACYAKLLLEALDDPKSFSLHLIDLKSRAILAVWEREAYG